MSGRSAQEIRVGYEALRAAATGRGLCDTPRGWTLLLSQGLPAWMRAWTPLPASSSVGPVDRGAVTTGVGAEMVRVLTEMALGGRPRLVVS